MHWSCFTALRTIRDEAGRVSGRQAGTQSPQPQAFLPTMTCLAPLPRSPSPSLRPCPSPAQWQFGLGICGMYQFAISVGWDTPPHAQALASTAPPPAMARQGLCSHSHALGWWCRNQGSRVPAGPGLPRRLLAFALLVPLGGPFGGDEEGWPPSQAPTPTCPHGQVFLRPNPQNPNLPNSQSTLLVTRPTPPLETPLNP